MALETKHKKLSGLKKGVYTVLHMHCITADNFMCSIHCTKTARKKSLTVLEHTSGIGIPQD
jgi:hypothetical protein